MQVIARIPDVSLEPTTAASRAESAPGRGGPVSRPRAAARPTAGSAADRFTDLLAAAVPTWPVAALAVIAVLTWMIASRNEHARLQRQRGEVRMACEPTGAPAGSSSEADGGGAVIR